MCAFVHVKCYISVKSNDRVSRLCEHTLRFSVRSYSISIHVNGGRRAMTRFHFSFISLDEGRNTRREYQLNRVLSENINDITN